MTDLDRRAEIHDLVVRFYREIAFDDVLGPIFSEVAETDWAVHMPRLTAYWCRVLLGEPGYDGWFLAPHRRIHETEAFPIEAFDRWYRLFAETVDASWSGPLAETAKAHAAKMMGTLARQLVDVTWAPAS